MLYMGWLPLANYGTSYAYGYEYTFTVIELGTYWYLYTYPGHAEKGMYGEIIAVSNSINRLAQAVLDCVSDELVLRVVVIDPTNVASAYLDIAKGLGVNLREFINYIVDHKLLMMKQPNIILLKLSY